MNRPASDKSCSVVICCYTDDRWDVLSAAIQGAAEQLIEPDELIVVVDFNQDLLTRVTDRFSDIATVIPNSQDAGLSGARNTGVEAAANPIVLFLDDDASPEQEWRVRLVAPFEDPGIVGVGGRADPVWAGGEAPSWMPNEFLWVVGCSYRGLPETRASVRNPIGCNMAFRRDAMRSVGGFSAALGRVKEKPVGGEETDLAIRIREATGGDIIYEPAAGVQHNVTAGRMTFSYFSRRCYLEGRSKAILARRVGAGDATQSERSYLKTLASGFVKRIGRTITRRQMRQIGQAAMLGLGLFLTASGFVVGTIASLKGKRQ